MRRKLWKKIGVILKGWKPKKGDPDAFQIQSNKRILSDSQVQTKNTNTESKGATAGGLFGKLIRLKITVCSIFNCDSTAKRYHKMVKV